VFSPVQPVTFPPLQYHISGNKPRFVLYQRFQLLFSIHIFCQCYLLQSCPKQNLGKNSCTLHNFIYPTFQNPPSYLVISSGVIYLHKLYLRYSTGCGEREPRPFREEPETFISIFSTTHMHLEPFVMHSALPTRPQPLPGVFNLFKFDHISKKERKKVFHG